MASISIPTALAVASTAATVGSSLLSSGAASSAAGKQVDAANNATALTQQQYQQTRNDLAPYRASGEGALNALGGQMPYLESPFIPTQANLEATPGYQFTLNQGLQGVQNSASAKGLGISGAALKGAAQYATGLADNTYQTQFNIDQANKTNAFNKLMGLVGVGQSSANQTGAFGQQSAQNAGNFSTSGANAAAAGTIGGANALSSGFNNAGSGLSNSYLLNKLIGGNTSNSVNTPIATDKPVYN